MSVTITADFRKTFQSLWDLQKTYDYLTDFERAIPYNFSGLEKFERVEELVYRWLFKKMGYAGYEIVLDLTTRFISEPFHTIRIEAVKTPGESSLSGAWHLKSDDVTLVTFEVKLMAEIPVPFFLKSVASSMAQRKVTEFFEHYISNVEKVLSK